MGDVLPKKRKQKMTFGKKFVEKFGEDKTCEISVANLHAAVETFLRSMKAIKDSDEVYAISFDDTQGKKPMDLASIKIKVRKEVQN
jgi:hypothetical protein